jgi:hypothetical protein
MTPFLIGRPWSSLDDGGKRPREDLANFHTNCAHPASAAGRCRASSLAVLTCSTAERGQVSPPAANRVVRGGLLCAGPRASDRGRRGTAHGACCPRCATKLLSAALRVYCPAVLERRRVATYRGSIGADRAGDRTYETKAKVRRDHLTPSPSLSRRERDRRPPLPSFRTSKPQTQLTLDEAARSWAGETVDRDRIATGVIATRLVTG